VQKYKKFFMLKEARHFQPGFENSNFKTKSEALTSKCRQFALRRRRVRDHLRLKNNNIDLPGKACAMVPRGKEKGGKIRKRKKLLNPRTLETSALHNKTHNRTY
jgi:hypothetical protein